MSEKRDYARKFSADVYDKEYYEGTGSKSGYTDYRQAKGIVTDQFSIFGRVMGLDAGTMLDVGCAYGFGCEYYAQCGWKASGFDVSGFAIARAKELFPDLIFWVGDAANNKTYDGLSDKSVDLVTASELFEHIESDDVPAVLGQLQRVAKHGIFVVNAATAPLGNDWGDGSHDGDHGHLNHHNLSWWISECAKVGEIDWDKMFAFSKLAEKEHGEVHWHNRVIVVKFDDIESEKTLEEPGEESEDVEDSSL